ncbi:DNA polymerase III subunit delta [Clostridium vincentii]|uniref:DNA polymerase III subunit delta n=1 Tax=Clostridium vincentii TaxID=52704 RepID=A0A2T0BJ92_9CLOT|nr:DNA polymerase III subunit delta [Clostridium vincentii]PRR83940.1 DNA polymerase III subunit delta [Clostridium vincentii]
MITNDVFEKNIKDKTIKNSYIFCGADEELIKAGINLLANPLIKDGFQELNYIKIDGMITSKDDIMNACETMPFMGEKKVVLVYRANFLRDKSDSSSTKVFKEMKEYLKDIPEHTVLIMYYLFQDKRETPKKNKKLMSLDKILTIVHFDKLKKDKLIGKVQDIFNEKGKSIGKVELRFFCERVQNNFNVIKREIDKLIDYTNGRDIKKQDIEKLIPSKSEDDIFDLVDLISQKKIDKAIDILDELLFKADQHMLIITAIESQFKKLYEIKVGMMEGKRVDYFVSELRIPAFVCEKLMNLSSKFSLRQLEGLVRLCVRTERMLKSSGTDKTMELELMLVNTVMIKK